MSILEGTAAVVAIATGFWGLLKYIDGRVEKELTKEEVLKKISLLIKPDLIFDEDGSIISDRGASAFIKDRGISVSMGKPWDSITTLLPKEIRISFNKHLATPPILTPMNPDDIHIKTRRGTEHTWIFDLKYSGIDEPEKDQRLKRTFRLEIYQ